MRAPNVVITAKGNHGEFKTCTPGEKFLGALAWGQDMARWGAGDGWDFIRHWLCVLCLRLAEDNQNDHATADRWIERYRKLREVR